MNFVAGIAIDIFYGFAMAAIFLLLYASLPGETGLVKGITFGVMAWFFRVVMQAASQSLMFKIPASTVLYSLGSGLIEMLILGILYGLALKPPA